MFIKQAKPTSLETKQIINLGWKDSNLRVSVPKTDALPLGDTPFTYNIYYIYNI